MSGVHSFRALPDVDLAGDSMHEPLPLGPPETLRRGTLANGMQCVCIAFGIGPHPPPRNACRQHSKTASQVTATCRYYVRPIRKPKERAAVALAVRIGSSVETEEVRTPTSQQMVGHAWIQRHMPDP